MNSSSDKNNDLPVTCYAFSGVDVVVFTDGTAIGEIQSYSIDQTTGILLLNFIVLDIEKIKSITQRIHNSKRILIRYLNEAGSQWYTIIEGVSHHGFRMNDSVDNIAVTIQGQFTFTHVDFCQGAPGEEYVDILPNYFFTLGGNEQ